MICSPKQERASPASTRWPPRRPSRAARRWSTSVPRRSGAPRARFRGRRSSTANVLEWRLDPASAYRIPELAKRDRLIVLLCSEGFASSLAAATLCELGLQAVDVIDGFGGWAAAELPTLPAEFVPPGSG